MGDRQTDRQSVRCFVRSFIRLFVCSSFSSFVAREVRRLREGRVLSFCSFLLSRQRRRKTREHSIQVPCVLCCEMMRTATTRRGLAGGPRATRKSKSSPPTMVYCRSSGVLSSPSRTIRGMAARGDREACGPSNTQSRIRRSRNRRAGRNGGGGARLAAKEGSGDGRTTENLAMDESVEAGSVETGGGKTFRGPRAEWLHSFFKRFKPVQDKSASVTALQFEKPLFELDKRIVEVKKVAEENGVDVSSQVKELEARASQLRHETYSRLTPIQRLQVARHPNRPTFLDIVLNITDKFVELHGDRAGYDDPSLVCGIGSIDGVTFMFIGQQKGRNTKENIHRNFGMPTPNGYRKALRFMQHADKFGIPIITFVDTPGAYAGKKAEELGQGEAIAYNLREMFGFRVPILSVVIGEGGSGGALAIGCANKMLIMEHSVYYVASPEACAAILWKSRDKAGEATEALRITSKDFTDLGPEEIISQRYAKFRSLGRWDEDEEETEVPDQQHYRELLLAAERVNQLENNPLHNGTQQKLNT